MCYGLSVSATVFFKKQRKMKTNLLQRFILCAPAWGRVLLEEAVVVQVVKHSPASYGTHRFTTLFTRYDLPLDLILSQTSAVRTLTLYSS